MCTPNTELQFCTFNNVLEIKNIYVWTLNRYIKPRTFYFNGRIKNFYENLGNGISVENINNELNNENIFSFDYIPQENDRLHICFNAENKENYKHFSLIFMRGEWSLDRYSVLSNMEENIATGKIIIKEKS